MTRCISGALALAFLAGTGLQAAEQGTVGKGDPSAGTERRLELTPSQKTSIFTAIRRSGAAVTPPPGNVAIGVGAQLPDSIALRAFPDAVVRNLPAIEPYRYTIVNGTLVLIDPASMKVVATVRQ